MYHADEVLKAETCKVQGFDTHLYADHLSRRHAEQHVRWELHYNILHLLIACNIVRCVWLKVDVGERELVFDNKVFVQGLAFNENLLIHSAATKAKIGYPAALRVDCLCDE